MEGQPVAEKTAALLSRGEAVTVAASKGREARVIFCSGRPLGEPIAWGGPIVMNTEEELRQAFAAYRDGTFLDHRPRGM